jgi:L-serine deaminase
MLQKQMRVGAELPFEFDWRPWLEGSAIASFSVTQEGGLTVGAVTNSAGLVRAVVGMPTSSRPGVKYLTCSVVTNEAPPRRDSRTIEITTLKR